MRSVRNFLIALALLIPLSVFAQGFLAFPLACGDPQCAFKYQGAYTSGSMHSILDHSLKQNPLNNFWQYGSPGGSDRVVKAFNGEVANGTPSLSDEKCIGGIIHLAPAPGVPDMVINPASPCGSGYTSYDENPGYEYRAAMGTSVKAAAGGVVVNNGGQRCILTNIVGTCNDLGYVGIDHGNGYITQYGYLSKISVTAGELVTQGQEIGLSGDTSITGYPSLYFEVIKVRRGYPNNYRLPLNYAVVDPYGWVGGGEDPLSVIGVPSAKLWQ